MAKASKSGTTEAPNTSYPNGTTDGVGLLVTDATILTPQTSGDIASAEVHASDTNYWYLTNNAPGGYDINADGAWLDYTGAGITVAVVDSGIQSGHHQFAGRYNASIDYDYLLNQTNGEYKAVGPDGDYHGTAVAGNIAAAQDNSGNQGVAYGSTITSYRLVSDGYGISSSTIDDVIRDQAQVDISNNSWGFGTAFAADWTDIFESAYAYAETNGRGGKGTIFVHSAGNDGDTGENVNYSEMKNSRFVINVGAANSDGSLANFSTPGTPVLLIAPGTSIYTTDITGTGGYATGDFTSMNGTSFATPIVSGVVALMLDANANLGWRDVQEILAYSSRNSDPADSSWEINGATNWNGGGMHASESMGFGFVDATAAVRLAETWQLISPTAHVLSNEAKITQSSATLNASIGSNYTNAINIAGGMEIDHVEVQLNLTHTRVSDLVISLISPDGTESILFDHPPSSIAYQSSWSFSSTHHWGETGAGNWTLQIQDTVAGVTGTLQNWTLNLYGDTSSINDTYIYTNEFGGFTADAARKLLIDSSGNDTINASAVSSNSTINLMPGGVSTIAGNSLTIHAGTTIEHAIGGDGNDTILGNTSNNTLYGGRGNDTLDGGAGIDTLMGGLGDDIYYVDSLSDVVIEYANAGNDTIYSTLVDYVLSANVELLEFISGGVNITGSSGNDTINGNDENNNIYGVAGNDVMAGFGGNDILDGGTGNDAMTGGAGDDLYYVDNVGDTVTENANEGTDTIRSQASYTLGANIENLILLGTAINANGNALNNTLTGNDQNNWLNGQDGNDTLDGGLGNDQVYGGIGNDTMTGGAGVDSMYGNDGDDLITGDAGADYIVGGAGIDTMNGGDDNDQLWGGDGDDILNGGAGNDLMEGGNGNDAMTGGAGDDSYRVYQAGDTVSENAAEGTDTVYAQISFALTASVENLILLGADNLNGTGNAENNSITGTAGMNTLDGGDGNDNLNAGMGNDVLIGGNGNDFLYGGGNADTMTGGAGNDTYHVDNTLDVVTENANEGTDSVQATLTHTLLANVENLYLQGTNNMNGYGNAQANTIVGNSGNNVIYGYDSNDYLSAGAGNDSVLGGNGNDTLIGGTGNDILYGEAGNDSYSGFTIGFGDDTVIDVGGIELIDLSAFNSSAATWSAIDSNTDGRLDRLQIDLNTGDSILIGFYFNNTNIDDDFSGAGAGYIEEIRFSNTSIDLADVQALIA